MIEFGSRSVAIPFNEVVHEIVLLRISEMFVNDILFS